MTELQEGPSTQQACIETHKGRKEIEILPGVPY